MSNWHDKYVLCVALDNGSDEYQGYWFILENKCDISKYIKKNFATLIRSKKWKWSMAFGFPDDKFKPNLLLNSGKLVHKDKKLTVGFSH